MKSTVPAIKRCDSLLISALKLITQGNVTAALSELTAARHQLNAIIDLLTPHNHASH
jgi:hypothetical protein